MNGMGKRVLSLLLCCSIGLSLLPAWTARAESGILYGDADDSGKVDLQDVLLMEKHIAGESVVINEINADVNCDYAIDEEDVRLVREYLAGNLPELAPVLCTVTFDFEDGTTQDIPVGKGYFIQKDIPTAEKSGVIFAGWQREDGTPFFQTDTVEQDIRLTPTYKDIDFYENLSIDSFALTDQEPTLSFRIEADLASAAEVAQKLSVIPKDGSDPVEIEVTQEEAGTFAVKARDGFTPGASYAMTLEEPLSFEGKDAAIRTAVFVIKKEQKDELRYTDGLIFIQDTESMKYTIGEDTTDMLELGLFTNDEDSTKVAGTFRMSGTSLQAGDYVCIYEGDRPDERDYTENDYEGERLAYIKITGVAGEEVSFESLGAEDIPHVLRMPDSVPFRVSELPAGPTGQVDASGYDAYARTVLGLTNIPAYEDGDLLIFYTVEFDKIAGDTPVRYAQVTGVQGDKVSYVLIDKDDIDSYMGMFISRRIENDGVLDQISQATLDDVKKQAIDSGFVDEAVDQMLQSALKTDTLQAALLKNGLTSQEISALADAPAGDKNRLTFKLESKKVTPRKIAGDDRHFEGGWGIGLDIRVVFSLEKKVTPTVTNSLKIELSVSFEQEIAVDLDVNVEDKWEWYLCIPVLEELSCYIAFDIQSFSSVSVSARIYTNVKIDSTKWETITTKLEDPEVQQVLREINKLGVLVKKYKGYADKVQEYLKKIEELRKKLPKFDFGGGEELTFEEMEEQLGVTDVSTEFEEVLAADSADDSKAGLEKLVDRYADMLNQESSWLDLYTAKLLDKDIYINIVTIKIKIDFAIKVNVNISLGADLEYQTGKRYNFWVHVLSGTAGSSEMDLLDERFAFQFYVMGALGLKAGVKAEVAVGVISTKIASVGATVEFGPYLRIYGYFFYTYTKMRPENTTAWIEDTEMMGALYLEFGLYLVAKFKAQAFEGTFTYNPTLFDREFPLLTAGVQKNVYGFVSEPKKTDTLRVIDSDGNIQNGIQMSLPASYRLMKTLDLRKGTKTQEIYESGKFLYRLSNRNFSINDAGLITVTPPDNTRYMKCDLTITWKSDKVAFSKYDISVTVPLVWTNLSEEEQNQTFTASFAFGNIADGYETVASRTYSRMDTFDLPSNDEMLELGGYNDFFAEDGTNLKYSAVGGYADIAADKTTGLTLSRDTTFYFDVTLRKYTLTVQGVKNADGGTESRRYTATYGDSFDVSNLAATGARNPSEGLYSSFAYLAAPDDETAVFDADAAVDLSFYNSYGADAVMDAVYTNEALTATYSFLGIDAPDKTVVFKKGETPYFEGLTDYIVKYGGEYASLIKITPVVAKMEHDIRYIVLCQPNNPKPTHTLYFETNGGSTVCEQKYPEGTPVQRPFDPTRTGYSFAGWYADPGMAERYNFDVMPEQDVTVYAGWEADTYEVALWSQGRVIATVPVTYDSAFGELPSPEKQSNIRFTGWYTEPEGGEEITAQTIVSVTGDITLYARWQEKATINISNIDRAKQTYIYNTSGQTFQVKLGAPYTGLTGFVLAYRKANTGSNFVVGLPVNAGTYDIQINRPTDDEYKVMDEITIEQVLVIEKATPTVRLGNLYASGNIVRATPPVSNSDGVLTHCLKVTDSNELSGTYTSATGLFTWVKEGRLEYYVKYTEGENYKAIDTSSSTSILTGTAVTPGSYRIDLQIQTANLTGAGTDDDVYGGVSYYAGRVPLVLHVYPDDEIKLPGTFEKNDLESFTITYNKDPWSISSAAVRKIGTGSWTGDWDIAWAQVFVTDNTRYFGGMFAMNVTLYDGNDTWNEKYDHVEGSVSFYRNITDVSAFYNGGAAAIDLNTQTTDYTYSFSGTIKDQFYPDGYNCLTHALGPAITVTSGNSAYDQFIRYTGVASFSVDTAGLAAYIAQNGGSDFKYTVTMDFSSTAETATRVFTKEIAVTVPAAAKRAAGVFAGTQPNASARTVAVSAVPMNRTLSDSFVFSAETRGAKKGQLIDVPVSLEASAPLWGVWGSIGYDADVLELTGCGSEGLFDESGVTLHKELTAVPYRFLATRSDLTDAAVNGKLFTLTFRVKEDIPDQSSEILVTILQGINAQGQELDFTSSNGAVLVDSRTPVISGVEDGGVYYTTQIAAVEDANLQSVTLNGEPVTAPVTLDGNVEATYTIVATDMAGYTSTCTVTMKPIAVLAAGIEAITLQNVKSSDKAAIESARSALEAVDTVNATQAEKNALKEGIGKCDALLAKIAGTAAEIRRLTDAVNGYDPQTVKAADKAALEKLVEDIQTLISSDNVTEDEAAALGEIKTRAENLLDKMSEGTTPGNNTNTGVTDNLFPWVALLIASGGAAAGCRIAAVTRGSRKKRKTVK